MLSAAQNAPRKCHTARISILVILVWYNSARLPPKIPLRLAVTHALLNQRYTPDIPAAANATMQLETTKMCCPRKTANHDTSVKVQTCPQEFKSLRHTRILTFCPGLFDLAITSFRLCHICGLTLIILHVAEEAFCLTGIASMFCLLVTCLR